MTDLNEEDTSKGSNPMLKSVTLHQAYEIVKGPIFKWTFVFVLALSQGFLFTIALSLDFLMHPPALECFDD